MSSLSQISGAQPQKQTKFAPIYTGRWSSGIWTNRSPLRDANSMRLVEKFYGPAGDALIAGLNTEITNRLTLARRPGTSVYDGSPNDSNVWTSVNRFYEFRLFSPTIEQIIVMVDQTTDLYSLYNGVQSTVWHKSINAGRSFMQSVGNILFFGNGVDNKKWLQTVYTWSGSYDWTTASTPVLTTYLIDPNGNIQQLTTIGVSDITQPTWSTQVPNSGNNFTGGTTVDGTAVWTNRGTPVENWGIVAPTDAPVPVVNGAAAGWATNTFYSIPGVVIDTNGNLQQVTTPGLSGSGTPTWNMSLSGTTTDGTVVWTMIQTAASLVWAAHTQYGFSPQKFVVVNVGGTAYLFGRSNFTDVVPTISGNVTIYVYPHTGTNGQCTITYPTMIGSASFTGTNSSILFNDLIVAGGIENYHGNATWATLNGAGEITANSAVAALNPSTTYNMAVVANLVFSQGGQYAMTILHKDGMYFGMNGGVTRISGNQIDPGSNSQTAINGYTVLGAENQLGAGGGEWGTIGVGGGNFVISVPSAGTYALEVDYTCSSPSDLWQQLIVLFNGFYPIPTPVVSSTSGPPEGFPIGSGQWVPFANFAPPGLPASWDSTYQQGWYNYGPVTDFVWHASTNFTLPDTIIIDPNLNQQEPFETGVSGQTIPDFSTQLYGLTNDNPNLKWCNIGQGQSPLPGTLTTADGGWQYGIALVNTLDNTVSNLGQLSPATGNHLGLTGVVFAPGSGLPSLADIDPQADYVAIFRTTDGGSIPFLIPGTDTTYTVPLHTYITAGYTDTTTDEGLNNLIEAATEGQNTPPAAGAINLTFHLNRIFFSVGNTVYWTSGPDTPVGNGVNGVSPLNYDVFPSLVKRIVPVAVGALVFTVSDIYLIQGQGTSSNPILGGQPMCKGIGLLSYDALDINGSLVGLFTTDNQFIIIDPSSGLSYAGFPIGDQFRLNDGNAGTSWDASKVYVTWHVQGEDQAWYVSDGQFGWYRLMPTPAPESGYCWSPYAQITGGCQAVQSIEVTPGVHRLLLGPFGTGPILQRDLSTSADDGTAYIANATLGSAVLAQPGQVATVSFITTESVKIGTPLWIGLLIDEAYPYYLGPTELLTAWVPDPPTLKPSTTILGQRFYLHELKDEEQAPVCRHMQIQVNWAQENVANELLTLTLFGGYLQET